MRCFKFNFVDMPPLICLHPKSSIARLHEQFNNSFCRRQFKDDIADYSIRIKMVDQGASNVTLVVNKTKHTCFILCNHELVLCSATTA